MSRVRNAIGGTGDDDPRPPPRLPAEVKGKGTKKTTSKKWKFADADTMRAAVVAAVGRAERGGAQSGVVIADLLSPAQRAAVEQVERRHGSPARTVMLEGCHVALEESQPQGEPQQQTQLVEQSEGT